MRKYFCWLLGHVWEVGQWDGPYWGRHTACKYCKTPIYSRN